jgi:subtilisin family serine protease
MGSVSAPRRDSLKRLAGLGFAAAAMVAVAIGAATPAAAAEGQVLYAGSADSIQDSYVVVFKDSVSALSVDSHVQASTAKYGGAVKHTYRAALHGYAATMSDRQARRLAADPAVAYVQQDRAVHITDVQPSPPSWGLDRVDQRNLPLDNSYTFDTTASNVTAYVIDTGIRITHQTFGGRATWGTNTVGDGNNTDCNGHGTHVSGTIGGSQYGVAKGIHLVAVKVLDCAGSGSFSGVAAGIDFVTAQHQAGQPAVGNMSLGASGTDAATETAVRNAVADGVVMAIASGNSNADACNFTPARVAEAITVNASDINDARASFSNFGTCTDIFGPGVNITSSWMTNDTATNTISGTSMATPHAAGVAALWLANHPGDTPAQVATALINNSTLNKITNPGTGSPNRLLFTNPGGATPGTPSVANPGNRTGTVGTATSLQLSASGGTPPYTWSATGLPTGLSINASSGLISGTPTTAGTFSVTATARDTANQTGSTAFSWAIGNPGSGCAPVTNGTDVPIPDLSTATSTIAISGCSGTAGATSTIEVHIVHTWIGDLVVDLVAPDGTVYNLHNRAGGSTDNINQVYTRNLSTETANGTWTLRVRDAAALDTGRIDSWTLDL